MNDYKELEVKLLNIDKDEIKRKLKELGASKVINVHDLYTLIGIF